MAIFDKYVKTKEHNGQSQKTKEVVSGKSKSAQALDASPDLPKSRMPIEEQAKEKLTTTGFFKAIYAKDSVFSKTFNNLELSNLKYIFDNRAIENYIRTSGNEVKKSSDFSNLKTIKESLPDMII